MRAVIFDLWDTLALWPGDDFERVKRELAGAHRRLRRRLGHDLRRAAARDDRGRTSAASASTERRSPTCLRIRRSFTRDALVPREGALETLDELKRRGFKLGLISVCSSDVEEAWDETELAAHLDEVVLSCTVGLTKPDPRIYELACERLEVSPGDCLFVGDGANDELAGAERVGMRAVCVLPPGRDEPIWPEARGWEPTITRLPEVLALTGTGPC